jgi:fermentation-respiration switch protein FrsA (DUF1100 family)
MMSAQSVSPPPLKILMLHGYTQSGPLFHAKTRVLEKYIQKAFPGSTLIYPTGPLRLNPADVPGFESSSSADATGADIYGWWRRSNTADPPEYLGFDDGMAAVAKILATEGPFDGVVGFSQGAALTAMLASLLEGPSRREAFSHFRAESSLSIPFPPSFESLQHPSLKFGVIYSGFVAPGQRYKAFYDHPRIQTPTAHFLGSLDSVVDEGRSRALIDACGGEGKARVIWHPGGHFVPSGKQYLEALVDFIQSTMSPKSEQKRDEDENVEDMDVPF